MNVQKIERGVLCVVLRRFNERYTHLHILCISTQENIGFRKNTVLLFECFYL